MKIAAARAGTLLTLAILFAGAAAAWGHASFVRSEPPANSRLDSPPTILRVWFSEAVEPRFSSLEVLDGAGDRVDKGGVHGVPGDPTELEISLRPLTQGLYVVAWETLSAVDGHVARGNFALAVGIASPVVIRSGDTQELSASVFLSAAVRWIAYLAGAALVGPLALWLFVLRGIQPRPGLLPLGRIVRLAWIGLVLAAIGALVFQTAAVYRSGIIGTLSQLLFHTRYGGVWIVRIALLAALIPFRDQAQRGNAWGALLIGEGVLLTTSLNSHSAASGATLALLADWLHISAVSMWVGGLLGLVMIIRRTAAILPDAERWPLLARFIPRFSVLAGTCVATIIVTGSYLLWLHAGSVEALIETWYGRDLFAKLVLVTPLLLLGAFNLLIVRPRLAAAAGAADEPTAGILGMRFGRAVRGEAVLAAAVLLLTGILSSLPPARQTYAQIVAQGPLTMAVRTSDLRITAAVDPGRVGHNFVILHIAGPQGPVDDAQRVDVRLTYLDRSLGTAIEPTIAHGGGEYIAHGPVLGLAGHWQMEVLVRRANRDDVVADFRFAVNQTGGVAETPSSLLAAYPISTLIAPLGFAVVVIAGILALTRVYA